MKTVRNMQDKVSGSSHKEAISWPICAFTWRWYHDNDLTRRTHLMHTHIISPETEDIWEIAHILWLCVIFIFPYAQLHIARRPVSSTNLNMKSWLHTGKPWLRKLRRWEPRKNYPSSLDQLKITWPWWCKGSKWDTMGWMSRVKVQLIEKDTIGYDSLNRNYLLRLPFFLRINLCPYFLLVFFRTLYYMRNLHAASNFLPPLRDLPSPFYCNSCPELYVRNVGDTALPLNSWIESYTPVVFRVIQAIQCKLHVRQF